MTAADAPPPPPRRRRRAWRIVLAGLALLVLALGAAIWYALSESGLPFLLARVVAQSGGRLQIEGASGSVGSTMRFARLVWNGVDTTVEATDVVVEWHPQALFRRTIDIEGLGAGRVSITMKPSGTATTPPSTLALPLEVTIRHLAVAELTWRTGPRLGTVRGLQFGYRGSPDRHVVEGLRLVSEYGALTGEATLGAHAPLPLDGKVAVSGDGPLAGARLDATLGGTLAALSVEARGTLRGADLDAHAALTPFAGAPLAHAALTLRYLDASAFDAALPKTRVDVAAEVQPTADGFAGTARVTNEVPGPLDAERLPFVALSARYRWHPAALELDDLVAELPGDGRVSGRGRLPLGEPQRPSTWQLALSNVDPHALHTRLLRTRVRGEIGAEVDGTRQVVRGTLADGTNDATFAATIAERVVDVSSLRVRAGGAGVIAGRGRVALTGNQPFEAHLTAQGFDPSRFVASPPAALDGTLDVKGTLATPRTIVASATVNPGSRYGGMPVSGTAAATLALPRVRDISADARVGSAHVTLRGDAGAVGDRLDYVLDAPQLAELMPLLPATAPRVSGGGAHAEGTLRVEPGGPGGEVRLRATGLRLADGPAVTALTLDATIAPGGTAARPVPASARTFDAKLDVSGLVAGTRRVDDGTLDVQGTLARHTLHVRGRGAQVAVDAAASGALQLPRELAAAAWSGRVEALQTSGAIAMRLRSPATLEIARSRLRVADAHVEIADGRADVTELRLVDGRVDTRGTFTGVPLASVLTLAGTPSPLGTTLVLGGEWDIAATPRLTGRFAVRRERGDLYASASVPVARNGVPGFGITALELAGTLRDDALSATAQLASARAGDARAELSIGSVAGAVEGKLSPDAPLSGTLTAELASLAPLQPFMGTQVVVNGRLRAALRASGTLGAPVLGGTLDGDGLRVDAARYGVHVTDGKMRARLSGRTLALDELSFAGGDGRFTAHGALALDGAAGTSRVEWSAEKFRVTDRPDLRLVLAGNGTLALVDKRVALKGTVRVEEGRVEYDPSPPGRLGPDVVVKGRATEPRRDTAMTDLPLTLDLEVELRRLTFLGEGLDAALAGRVRVTTGPDGALRGRGTIRTVYGTYYAFGQRLTIDRGRLIFDGPLDNPALDVVALRKNLAVEAGVELTGTVKTPLVRITSNPPVPENEALAWLITGQGLSSGGRGDYAALSAAAAALAGRGGKPITTQIAEKIGLTDISLESSGTATGASTNPVAGQVVVFGKRISDRLTIGYEQGLSLASGALRLEYALTRTLTLRAEAGTSSSIGLYYRRAFDSWQSVFGDGSVDRERRRALRRGEPVDSSP